MRQLLLFTLILFISTSTSAQSMASEGNQWNVTEGEIVSPRRTTTAYRIRGDTVLDGTAYKILEFSTDSTGVAWSYYNVIREDSLGRVYFGTNEELLYDFSLNPGDTVAVSADCSLQVTAVDSITLGNGEVRKRLTVATLRSFIPGPFEVQWIEGVGSVEMGFQFGQNERIHCATDYQIGLQCFIQNGESVFPVDQNVCWIRTATTEATRSSLEVWPNPVTDHLRLNNLERVSSLTVHSATGQQIQILRALPRRLDTSTWPRGLYLLSFGFSDGSQLTKKVLKR
ncbi:MAG: T9SS type A sorting domain-containing protein [Bacteroidota bacterium]